MLQYKDLVEIRDLFVELYPNEFSYTSEIEEIEKRKHAVLKKIRKEIKGDSSSIEYRKGDLLKAFKKKEVDVIGHQCNCFHSFGAGIAAAIRVKFPGAFEADLNTPFGNKKKLGTISESDGVYNLYGQFRTSTTERATDYKALKKAMIAMRESLELEEGACGSLVDVIGFPKIGCGLGGGDWSIVSEIIKEVFIPKYKIVVYEL